MASIHSYFSLLLILALSLSELDVSLARRSLLQSTGSSSIGSLTSTGSKTTTSASPTGLSGSTSPSKPKSSTSSSGLTGLSGLSEPAGSSSHASGLSGSTGSGIGLSGSTGSSTGLSGSTSTAISTPTPTTPKTGFPFPMPDLGKIIPDIVALNKDLVAIIRGIRSGNTAELPQIVKNLIPHIKKLLGDLPKPKPPTATALPAANTVQPQIVF